MQNPIFHNSNAWDRTFDSNRILSQFDSSNGSEIFTTAGTIITNTIITVISIQIITIITRIDSKSQD